jgi:hypothetical protein
MIADFYDLEDTGMIQGKHLAKSDSILEPIENSD